MRTRNRAAFHAPLLLLLLAAAVLCGSASVAILGPRYADAPGSTGGGPRQAWVAEGRPEEMGP